MVQCGDKAVCLKCEVYLSLQVTRGAEGIIYNLNQNVILSLFNAEVKMTCLSYDPSPANI